MSEITGLGFTILCLGATINNGDKSERNISVFFSFLLVSI